MTEIIFETEKKIKNIIDDLKGLCNQQGLSNQAAEEEIITSIFLYKFLNDKFMYNLNYFAKEINYSVEDVLNNKDKMLKAFYDYNSKDVTFEYEDTIQYLINRVNQENFGEQFDNALKRISENKKNERFLIERTDGSKDPLFSKIVTRSEIDASKRNNFAKAIFGIISQDKFDFSNAFENNFDFYATVFEYLIKDYNVASGTYAEYFTPQVVSSIIAKILVGNDKIDAAEIYDPSAGSGSLILHLANEIGKIKNMNKAVVYTQDISNKSTRFLRLNMMINGLTESMGNIIQGDTLLNPSHFTEAHNQNSGLKKFDFITSNPPFKVDFSSTRDQIENKWNETTRFFAGVPNIPNKKKESMAIYLLFIQHILFSLKDNGRAAIVVPTGFLTAQSGIEKKIREKIINEKILKGVISMPSNIFANTGTNVSILFIDKSKDNDEIVLIDASKLGTKEKVGKNERTVLNNTEIDKIISTFTAKESVENFSIIVSNEEIKNKNYSFSAGQYFKISIKLEEISEDVFNNNIKVIIDKINENYNESGELLNNIKLIIKDLQL